MKDTGRAVFDPRTNKFPYPAITDRHYLEIKKDNGNVYDENYPYIDDSFSFRFRRKLVRILLYTIVFPATYVRLGLRTKGKENLKKHRAEIENGVISCSNHIHLWDYICVMKAAKPKKTNVLVWAPNVSGENGTLIRLVGGIPIPKHDMKATKTYLNSLKELLNGGWLHVYSEGSMWEYYQPIRPFKHGAAYLACAFDRPILPMAFSYRKPGFIRRKLFRQIALLNLNVGEPLYPDKSLPMKQRKRDLTVRSHEAVCRLAGIDPKDNLYPQIFSNNERVDYYTDTYGINYHGSH